LLFECQRLISLLPGLSFPKLQKEGTDGFSIFYVPPAFGRFRTAMRKTLYSSLMVKVMISACHLWPKSRVLAYLCIRVHRDTGFVFSCVEFIIHLDEGFHYSQL
jgi:hypothetical protein